jgi:cyclohexadienyl dehydratase
MRRRSAVGALLLLALSLALGVALWRTRVRSGHSGDLEALRRRGVLRVGTSGDYAPFTLAQGPEITGLDAELATRAARDLGVRVEFVRFSWGNLLADLKAGRFDIGASGITLRPERALAARCTRPYATSSAVLLAPREVAQRMPDPAAFDRSDVRIAVNRGGYLERVAHRFFPHATILPTDDNRRLLDPVLGNGADAALSDSAEARGLAHPELVRLGPLTRDHKGLLVGERAPELADWLDDWLRARELDGFVSALRRKHLGDESATADMTVEAIVADVGLRMGLMPLVAAAKARKALPIEDRSQEARVLERIAATATRYAISPTDTRTLYDVLIRASKEVQRASSASAAASADVGPALDDLRDAIRRIDEHLMHSLRDAVEAGSTANFPALLQNSDLGDVSASTRADMAAALAKFTHAPH